MRRLSGLLISGLLIVGSLTGCTCTAMEVNVGPLSIQDSEIVVGEPFIVEAGVTNIGENDGTFSASIRLDGKVVEKQSVSIAAGATEMVQFDCIAETPGTHTLRLNDSTATFTALKPADFEVTFLSIPKEAYMRQAIVIESNVTNIGEVEGLYNERLMVDGTEKASSDTPIAPGATETISFTMTIDTPGTYTISLDGATATLTVFLAFPDANLETAVREAINKPEGHIYISDLEPITALNAQNKDISDITGLECFVNLQVLELRDNNISNISPLAGLINIRELGLWGNDVSDISPLAGLTNLEILHLHHNNISDISTLENLTFLHILHLPNNNISDISPLAGLAYLCGIDLEGNNINDISPLEGLTKLMDLSIKANNISDISPLAGLTDMHILHLHQNNISDISPLVDNSGLAAGDTVDLRYNPLSTESINVYIPQLEARGVDVAY